MMNFELPPGQQSVNRSGMVTNLCSLVEIGNNQIMLACSNHHFGEVIYILGGEY